MWNVLRAQDRSIPGCERCLGGAAQQLLCQELPLLLSHLLLPQASEEPAAPTVGTALDLVVKDTSGSGGGCPRRGPHLLPSHRSVPPGPRRGRRIAGSVTAGAAPGAAAAASDTLRSQQRHRSPGHFPARWETRG